MTKRYLTESYLENVHNGGEIDGDSSKESGLESKQLLHSKIIMVDAHEICPFIISVH